MSSQEIGDARRRVIVHGATGRMGARLCARINSDDTFALVAAVASASSSSLGRRAVADAESSPIVQNADEIDVFADVVIDFSRADAVHGAVACAQRADAALLVGTTGLTPEQLAVLEREAAHRAVLIAPNTALGVHVSVRVASEAAKLLGDAFSCSIIEAHHAGKRDAPSGTALRLQRAIEEAGAAVNDVHAIRAGDTIGEHTVRFDGPGESIEITHRAVSRDLFVLGAMRAGAWLSRQGPGMYTMEDALGFSPR